jgi:hypothetical protein
MGDNLLSPATISAGRRHQPESAQEKAVPAAGRMRAGTASDEEHGRYSLRQRYAEGVYSSGTQISVACYSGIDPRCRSPHFHVDKLNYGLVEVAPEVTKFGGRGGGRDSSVLARGF